MYLSLTSMQKGNFSPDEGSGAASLHLSLSKKVNMYSDHYYKVRNAVTRVEFL